MQKPMISVRRRSTLAQTIRTENWLHDMAQKGVFPAAVVWNQLPV